MKYRIGLDIGISSVGWAAIECDNKGEPIKIMSLGSRIFDTAEHPKTGASLATPRREARAIRRSIRRRAHRVERVKWWLELEYGENIIFEMNEDKQDIYYLRVKGLDEKLSNTELARLFLYFVKHRGYNSTSSSEEQKDEGMVKSAVKGNSDYYKEKGYRTLGEMLYKDSKFFTFENGKKTYHTRNHEGEYGKCFLRSDIENEIGMILSKQKEESAVSEKLCEKYKEIFTGQRSYDEGPANPSKYRIENYPVKKCIFETEEDCAPKSSYMFEYFCALQKINNLKIQSAEGERILTEEERKIIIETVKSKKEYSFGQLRKLLKLTEDQTFNLISYSSYNKKDKKWKSVDEIEKAKFVSFNKSYELMGVLSASNKKTELIDKLAVILSHCKTDGKRIDRIKSEGLDKILSDEEISSLLKINCKAFGALSIKAMRKLIPYMENGMKYVDACSMAGWDFRAHKKNNRKKLLSGEEVKSYIDSIKSPVVRRSISQTVKVINAIINKYGSPVAINVEMAREMTKTKKERDIINTENKEREENYKKEYEYLQKEFGIVSPTPIQVVKFRLYNQQGGKCAYSLKELGDIYQVLSDKNYCQIDHIIPYSRSFDDSYSNKVLVLTSENQNKRNMTPYEYFGNTERWEEFEKYVNAQFSGAEFRKKRENLLRTKFNEQNSKDWKERALQDTKIVTTYIYNLLNDNLEFDEIKGKTKKVLAVNGKITDYLRKFWGLSKNRSEGDKHHAQDAVVIACTTDGMIQKLSLYNKIKENHAVWDEKQGKYVYSNLDGELLTSDEYDSSNKIIEQPYLGFRDELIYRMSDTVEENKIKKLDLLQGLGYNDEEIDKLKSIFVSRMPDRKAKGEIHKQTIFSGKKLDNGVLIERVSLEELKLNSEKTEIINYSPTAKRDDKLLYNALLERLKKYDGDGKKAFAEPFYKPKTNGENGNLVRKVCIEKTFNSGFIFKNKSLADNGSMVRVDIFRKDGKYYAVPIYTKDIYAKKLPNKAINSGKSIKDWIEIDDSFEFLFSLFKNDVVKIESKTPMNFKPVNDSNKNKVSINEGYFYFNSIDVSSGSIKIIKHDNSFFTRVGLKTLPLFEKYFVDVFGNLSKVKKEKRLNSEWLS